jgi:hypothetical protein
MGEGHVEFELIVIDAFGIAASAFDEGSCEMVTSRHANSLVSVRRLPYFDVKWKIASIHRRACNYSFFITNGPMLAVYGSLVCCRYEYHLPKHRN